MSNTSGGIHHSSTTLTKLMAEAKSSLYRQAFDVSLQAFIVFNMNDGKVMLANQAASKLLRYSNKELLTKTKPAILNMATSNVKIMLAQVAAKGKSSCMVQAIRKNGKGFPCVVTIAVFQDEAGNPVAMTTFSDMSKRILKQKNLDAENEKMVAVNIALAKSKQQDIDTRNKKVVADNISIAKFRQKKIDLRNEKVVADNINIAKSRQKKIDLRNEKTSAGNLKFAVSRQMRIDAEENRKTSALIFNSSSDVLYDMDISTSEVLVSDGFEKEFGYKTTSKMKSGDLWSNHIHPDDKEALIKDYKHVMASDEMEWKYSCRFLKADNTVANILGSSIILRKLDGTAYRLIGSMQDISTQKVLEDKLDREIKLKEQQIASASEDAKEVQRSEIGRELHDNVNQLLGASKMYLDMAKRGGENSPGYLARSSEYTQAAIEEIRKLTRGLVTDKIELLGLPQAIREMAADIMEVKPVKIVCSLKNFETNRKWDEKFKLNIFRIAQEHLNNILKHAAASAISIKLIQKAKSVVLSITDDGIGFDVNAKEKGIGLANIKGRATSYNGTAVFASTVGQGCKLTATFPIDGNLA